MHYLRISALAILLSVLAVAPAAARQATPAASPVASPAASPGASPVAGGGWTVASERTVPLAGTAASLSPDGAWIAGTNKARQFCVWSTADGAGSCQGQDLAVRPETITWAPDSSAVAFSLNAVEFMIDSDIYIYDVRERKLHDLTDDGVLKGSLLKADERARPLAIDDAPAWSPDGTELAFVRTTWDTENHPTQLMRIARAGGKPTPIRTIDKEAPFAVYEPMRWLPDGHLLFTIALPDLKNHRNGIWRIGLDGTGLKQLLDGDRDAQIPMPWIADISPDGALASVYSPLIQGQYVGRKPAFFLVDLKTFEATPVRAAGVDAIGIPPRFSPDGASLIYAGLQQGQPALIVQHLTTGQATTLVPDAKGAVRGRFTPRSGLQWAANDTVMIGANDGVRLLTLAPAA